jgi:hypothetical protein
MLVRGLLCLHRSNFFNNAIALGGQKVGNDRSCPPAQDSVVVFRDVSLLALDQTRQRAFFQAIEHGSYVHDGLVK